MREIDLKELKKIEISILEEVHKICIQEGLRYSLAGGTLIGAIRHKGFIPWDDDIDIIMPRPDYKKFISYCQNRDIKFELLCNEINTDYGYLFAKAMAKNTVIYEQNGNRNNLKLGVHIDIFPIDGLGNSYKEAKRNFLRFAFERELIVASNWSHFFRSKTHSFIIEPIRLIFYLISRIIDFRKLIFKTQTYYEHINFDSAKIIGSIAGSYRLKEIMPQYICNNFTEVDFENKHFMAIKYFNYYLRKIYGDYMQLPSDEKQKSHHFFKAYHI